MTTDTSGPHPALSEFPKYYTLPDGRHIAFTQKLAPEGDKNMPGVVFLHGFRSDRLGTKAQAIHAFCERHHLEYLSYDMPGHGESSGDFQDFTIGDALSVSKKIIQDLTYGPQVIIGSSMGGWIALLLALEIPKTVHSVIGIAAAPDFPETLIWDQLSNPQRYYLQKTGEVEIQPSYSAEPFVLTQKFFDEARQHLILESRIHLDCPVRLLHGYNDDVVPFSTALELFEQMQNEDVQLTFIKDADHRLSRPQDIDLIEQSLANLLGLSEDGDGGIV